MKATALAFLVSLALFLTPTTGTSAQQDSKLMTRVETVTVHLRGRKLTVHAFGMASTPSFIGLGAHLSPHNGSHELNKDGLLEYDFYYKAPANYTGSRLKPVKASLKESSIPLEVKGVRVFGQFNDVTQLLAEPKKKKKKSEKKAEKAENTEL